MKSTQVISKIKAGVSNQTLAATAAYYLTFICLGLIGALLGPALPSLANHIQVSLKDISILFTVGSLGYMFGSSQSGRLYDRVSGNTLLAVTLVVTAVLMACVPLMPNLWLLSALIVLLGVVQGTIDAGGNLLLIWLHGDQSASFMNGLHFFFGVGAFLSPLVAAQVIERTGLVNAAYWIFAVAMLPPALLLMRVPSPAIRKKNGDQNAESKGSVFFLILLTLVLFLFVGAEGSFGGWIFSYASATGIGSTSAAGFMTSLFWISLTFGRLVSIPLARRFSMEKILLADIAGCVMSLLFLCLVRGSETSLWLGTFGIGFSLASIFPTVFSLAEKKVALTGKLSGWLFVGASAGGMVLPWLIGQLFEKVGPQVMMIAILIDVALGLVIFSAALLASRKSESNSRDDY